MKQKIKKGYKAINIKSEFNPKTNEVETSFDEQINPKKGDFVVTNGNAVAIVNNIFLNNGIKCFYTYAHYYPNFENSAIINNSYRRPLSFIDRYATEYEIKCFKKELLKYGKVFNEETKEVEDKTELIKIRKRAEKYTMYYYLNFNSISLIYFVDYNDDYHYEVSNKRHLINNYFLTKEAAQKAADELNAKLNLKEFFKNTKEE